LIRDEKTKQMSNYATEYCPICEKSTIGELREGRSFTHFFCRSCKSLKLVWSESEQIYPDEYFGNDEDKFGGITGYFRRFFHQGRAKQVDRLVQARNQNIYDVGCGDGTFLSAMKKHGFITAGLEPYDKANKQAEKKLGHPVDCVPYGSAPDQIFEAITAWQVIEHVEKPGELFDTVYQHLQPHGLFAFSTVNLSSFQAILFSRFWLHLDPPRHLWVAPRQEVEKLLQAHGFTIERRRWNFLEFGPIGYVDSMVNVMDAKRDRILKCLKGGFPGFSNKIFWITAAILTPFACTLSALEAMVGRPSTFEIYARKKAD
jgi:SAM-dependent methyltransferase